MTAEERRKSIINTIEESNVPLSGAVLAKKFGVSRQVIVQDIAILRSRYEKLVSTARGYMITNSNEDNSIEIPAGKVVRIYKVVHTDADTEAELNAIVDMGGEVVDVFIKHPMYGLMRGKLHISCRRHVHEFVAQVEEGQTTPLMHLTSGIHYHTVAADSEETLDLIEAELKKMNFLMVDTIV